MRLALSLLWLVVLVGLGCGGTPAPGGVAPCPAAATAAGATSISSATMPLRPPVGARLRAAAIAHGGVGSPPSRADGCRRAVDAALAALDGGAGPLDAAVAGVAVMEDDPRFNAGTGSRVRIDGQTVQMDASVMTSDGRFGAVAVIEGVRHPVKVARAVVGSPHLLLAGQGATAFARTLGMPPYDPATDEGHAKTRRLQMLLRAADPELPARWRSFDWRRHWNFERTLEQAGFGHDALGGDTVGVAVRGADGRFAVALSTGGTSITLRGRVGDVPLMGAGLYAGPHGAVAATGVGERIIEQALSRTVHGMLADGVAPDEAARRGVATIAGRGAVGLIVIGAGGLAAAADREMAWAAREQGSASYRGPDPAAAQSADGSRAAVPPAPPASTASVR